MSASFLHGNPHPSPPSHLTCKPFQLQPAPRPKNTLRKQSSKDSTISKASSAAKTCGSRSPAASANLLTPADFREIMSTTPDPSAELLDGHKCDEGTNDVKSSSTKFTERFSCVIIPEQEEADKGADRGLLALSKATKLPLPSSTTETPKSFDKGPNRWRGALPYRTSPTAPQDGCNPSTRGQTIEIRLIQPEDSPTSSCGQVIEPTTNTACLAVKKPKSSATTPTHQNRRRGDGWGGLRAPSSWFETTFVPGPLATPTPSAMDDGERRMLAVSSTATSTARGSTKRKSLLAKGSGAIANIVSMEVPPLPGVPFLAIGSKKKDQVKEKQDTSTVREDWVRSARSEDEDDASEMKDTRIRWAESPGRSGLQPLGDGNRRDWQDQSSSMPALHKTDDGDAATRFGTNRRPRHGQDDDDDEGEDADDEDERWKERLVLALQAAVRHAATAASDMRASFASVGSRHPKSRSKSKKVNRNGRGHGPQGGDDALEMVEVDRLGYEERPGHGGRAGSDPFLSRKEKEAREEGDTVSATWYGSQFADSQSGRGAERSAAKATFTSKQGGDTEQQQRRGWKHVLGWAMLVLLFLALLSNVVVLNVKVLSKAPHDQQEPLAASTSALSTSATSPAAAAPVNASTTATTTSTPTLTSTGPTMPAGMSAASLSTNTGTLRPSTSSTPSTSQMLTPPTFTPLYGNPKQPAVTYVPATSAPSPAASPSQPAQAGMVRRRFGTRDPLFLKKRHEKVGRRSLTST
ncbi:hypothetical protein CF326_g2334 [Tilletia indica]|nr:hypothetical protein CF326_g2334 [Tilletia indica]